VVVHYFDVAWSWLAVWPLETDTPLLIDADGVLPCPIAAHHFKAIAWQPAQGFEGRRGIEDRKPFRGLVFEALERLDELSARKPFGFLVSIAQDHLSTSIVVLTMYVKRQNLLVLSIFSPVFVLHPKGVEEPGPTGAMLCQFGASSLKVGAAWQHLAAMQR